MEVMRRYSNLPDVLKRAQDVLRWIEENDQTDEPGCARPVRAVDWCPFGNGWARRPCGSWRRTGGTGTPLRTLAERYGISLSSVKRVLRESSSA